MGRSRATATQGHNSGEPLTDDEVAALEAYYGLKIREQRRKAAAAKALYDTEREGVTSLFTKAKGDLKTDRKEFEDLLAKQDMTPVEFANWWKKTSARYARNGLNVGAQQELSLGDTADDKAMAHAMGETAGLRGDDPDQIPKTLATFLHPDFTAGWHSGQTKLAARMQQATDLLATRAAAAQAAKPELTADDEAEEEEDDADPEVIKRKAKALKESGWTEPTAGEATFEAAA
jgi:hypothetical protein